MILVPAPSFNVVFCKYADLGLFKSLFSKEITLHNLVDFWVFFELNTQCTCHLHYNTVALETFLLGNLIWVLF